MRLLIASLLSLVTLMSPGSALADQLLFDADQWGEVNIKSRQSSAGRIQSILAENANFERLSTYSSTTALRQLSKPVGRLDIRFGRTGQWTTCTATLIAVDVIITNYHCVPNIDRYTIPNGSVDVVTLVMGYLDETNEAFARKYEVLLEPIGAYADLDLVFLRVKGEPGHEWGFAKLALRKPEPGEGLFVIHHPGGFPKHVTRGRCRAASPRATDPGAVDLYHMCDTLPGSSGAPIFSDDDDTVIAIHRAGAEVRSLGAVNYGVLLTSLEEEIGRVAPGAIESELRPFEQIAPAVPDDREPGFIFEQVAPAVPADEQWNPPLVDEGIVVAAVNSGPPLIVRFKEGRAHLDNPDYSKVVGFARFLLGTQYSKLNITGHSDSSASSEESMAISIKRAEHVKDVLVRYGLPANTLMTFGSGETQPVASNLTIEGRLQNNRVDIMPGF